jgi:hypothetical protein
MLSIGLTVSVLLTLNHVHAALDPSEMQQRLAAGAPILGESSIHVGVLVHTLRLTNFIGTFNDNGSDMLKWMGSLSDDTLIETINIPGTHDACACKSSSRFSKNNKGQDPFTRPEPRELHRLAV